MVASSIFLDAMLVMLIAILAYVAVKKVFLPPVQKTIYGEARELLEKKIELRDNIEALKRQVVSGELDSTHYRAARNHQMQELALIERRLKRLGFA